MKKKYPLTAFPFGCLSHLADQITTLTGQTWRGWPTMGPTTPTISLFAQIA